MFLGTLMEGRYDCVQRDHDYWSYKISQPGVRAIRIAGVDVIVKLEGSLGLGDINTLEEKNIRRVLMQLRLFCFFSGIHRINTYLSPDSPLDSAFSKFAMFSEGLPIGYTDFTDSFSLRSVRYCYFDMDTF